MSTIDKHPLASKQPDPPAPKRRRTREERIAELQILQARDLLREELKIALEELAAAIRAAKTGQVPWSNPLGACKRVNEALTALDEFEGVP